MQKLVINLKPALDDKLTEQFLNIISIWTFWSQDCEWVAGSAISTSI